MKDFRTVVRIDTSNDAISLQTPIFTIGSCFSDNLGAKLHSYKVPVLVNPFGTTYNPFSIHQLLHYALEKKLPSDGFVNTGDVWQHYDFHSTFSDASRIALETKLTKTIESVHDFLRRASWLIITYGTAWTYERNDNHQIVANCHKQPSGNFIKSLYSQQRMIQSFDSLYQHLKAFNPALKIILTVSPVRHIKDTLPLNSVSKAVLRLGCHTLSEQYNDVHYFPAYEIMTDDLRDYRFYDRDMIHPSEEAIDYIWEKFLEGYATRDFTDFINRWKTIQTALTHKPFHPTSTGHQIFIKDTIRKLDELNHLVDVSEERRWLESQLID